MATKDVTYKLERFDASTFQTTSTNWNRQVQANAGQVIAAEYERILTWSESHLNYDDGDCFAYGVFKGGAKIASAIVEITYSRPGRKWLKMLNVHLSPSLDLAFFETEADSKHVEEIAKTYSAAVSGAILLTIKAHPANVIKLYARSGTLLAFFRGLLPAFQQFEPTIKCGFEGRFLVIKASAA